jgi:hypothetical protein
LYKYIFIASLANVNCVKVTDNAYIANNMKEEKLRQMNEN